MAYKIYIEPQGKSYPYDINKSEGSLPEESKISTKMKPLDREDANSEVEKGELILDPETGALHKALGNPHSKGGTPVSLKDNSFIFSNYKKLALQKEEKELFEFKLGGKKEKNNTPAKVLEREVDLEHHNKMVDILQNEKKHTKEAVNSAKLMMLKNLEKVGQVAYLQESKKDSQIPQFAQNTAPVYSKDTDEQITQSMQYLQQGGNYLPKYQSGNLTPEQLLLAQANRLKDTKGWNFLFKTGPKSYYDKTGLGARKKPSAEDEATYMEYLNSLPPEQKQAIIAKNIAAGKSQNSRNFGFTGEDVNAPLPRTPYGNPLGLPLAATFKPSATPTPIRQLGEQPGDAKGIIDPKNYNTKLTPWQLAMVGLPLYNALNVKTQYPLRQHKESLIPQFENINAQPQLDANNQAYFNAAALAKGMNPNQGGAYAQQLYGNRLSANNQVLGNVQNANVQTQNRQKELVANTLNADADQNRAFDLKYYDQTKIAQRNTSDLKQAYTQQGINNFNTTMEKKLAFDSWLNTQQQYKGRSLGKDTDGIEHFEGQALYTPKAGFFGNSIQYNPTGIDFATYQASQGSREEDDAAYIENMKRLIPGITPEGLTKLLDGRNKNKTLLSYRSNNMLTENLPKKLGGRYRNIR